MLSNLSTFFSSSHGAVAPSTFWSTINNFPCYHHIGNEIRDLNDYIKNYEDTKLAIAIDEFICAYQAGDEDIYNVLLVMAYYADDMESEIAQEIQVGVEYLQKIHEWLMITEFKVKPQRVFDYHVKNGKLTLIKKGKAKRYGQEFIELIKRHVEENEIERPEDLRVRTVPNKSKLKVSIIQRIDRKVPLDEIAIANGLDFSELLDEIEAIVFSGTRINIDYYLNEEMDEDYINDIYEYFKDSETDDLEEAIEELGGDYTEEDIRLVRIKFLSEMAN